MDAFNAYTKTVVALLQQVSLHETLIHKISAPFVTVTNGAVTYSVKAQQTAN